MDVFVFPAEGQEASQRSKDKASCYEWAVGNVGTDPFELAKQVNSDEVQTQAEQQAQQQVEAQSEQRVEATEEQLTNFKNAFSVCLEAKDYMVKY